ncbi:Metallo-beta-lactamase superfamily protein [Ruminococcus sp. YE71]|uniref:ComEC/Rec2 family competence protein n=1 Tax=unclassified Ruminococcus TaxID=2608920 RepID=UPI0008866B9C|nr:MULTISPECIES: ComEC/Rec2 family competence protein [unclassified Ruminococcus]SDA27782.1 Metallo-beta-lactamase superfamily protein [Ruminococcus sp. YE78]SFW46196.1 Metallo-beta-lactamase superfamily protein [Ruminococcus sp. YE71]
MAKDKKSNPLAVAVFLTGLLLLAGGAASFIKYHGLWDELPKLPEELGSQHLSDIIAEHTSSPETNKRTKTWVEFIDVGQGDCALVCSDGHYMLIDTGDRDSSDTVILRLQQLGVKKLDYLLLSHPHADHIGEAADICNAFETGSVIMPNIPDELLPDSVSYDQLVETAAIEDAEDMSYTFGECTFDTYAPTEYDTDLNNWSMLVKLTCGDCTFLFTGDCSFDEENSFLERWVDVDADVLKVGHHGSAYATGDDWLAAVSPQISVISCGAQNDYGHPSDVTVNKLNDYGSEVYITAEVGSVVIETDGETVWRK